MSIENIDTVPWRVVDDARWLGDDARYCDRGEISPPYPDIGLESGARMREDWFPVLWRANAAPT